MPRIFLALFLFAFPAFACEPRALRLTTPFGTEDTSPVTVQFSLEGSLLHARFHVSNEHLNALEKIPAGSYPYQYDVVELFFSLAGGPGLPYYELELSPFDETFYVKIADPKKPFENGISLPVAHQVARNALGWNGEFTIQLDRMGWDGNEANVIGNAFAVQGVKPSRRYYSLFLPAQAKPQFHLPDFFRPLLACPAQ